MTWLFVLNLNTFDFDLIDEYFFVLALYGNRQSVVSAYYALTRARNFALMNALLPRAVRLFNVCEAVLYGQSVRSAVKLVRSVF
jgi:hypothetical protein